LVFGLALVLSAAFFTTVVPTTAEAQQARNIAEFCASFQGVCNRTCTTGPGTCRNACASRRSACLTSGCFHFNSPGPRCFSNAAHRAMTDAKLAPDPERVRQLRRRMRGN
jgi:hypothetical protein